MSAEPSEPESAPSSPPLDWPLSFPSSSRLLPPVALQATSSTAFSAVAPLGRRTAPQFRPPTPCAYYLLYSQHTYTFSGRLGSVNFVATRTSLVPANATLMTSPCLLRFVGKVRL